MNVYLKLTEEFNKGRLRAVICSGQAVVLHHLAIMSKDGDWILREEEEALSHVLEVLSGHGALYRFGAPLDVRWMQGGWSSHFEYDSDQLRVRTDFFSRPPRLLSQDLVRVWREAEEQKIPFTGLRDLAEIKKTNREKDYAVIGEIARRMLNKEEELLYSRSALDIIAYWRSDPDTVNRLIEQRPLLAKAEEGRDVLEQALDAERREMMHANEQRLQLYMEASEEWQASWLDVQRRIKGLPLIDAHRIIVSKAEGVLPHSV